MESISHIESRGKVGSCIFNYSDVELMNLYRRAILEEIETNSGKKIAKVKKSKKE